MLFDQVRILAIIQILAVGIIDRKEFACSGLILGNEVFEPVVEPETKSETPVSTETKPVDTPVVKERETAEPIHEDAQPKKETPKETVETPFEKAVKNAENGVEEPVNNVVADKTYIEQYNKTGKI